MTLLTTSPVIGEFFNKCHKNVDGTFCSTAGGNKAGRSAAERAAAAKKSKAILSKGGGSTKPVAKKAAPKPAAKKAAPEKPKAAPAPAKKAAPKPTAKAEAPKPEPKKEAVPVKKAPAKKADDEAAAKKKVADDATDKKKKGADDDVEVDPKIAKAFTDPLLNKDVSKTTGVFNVRKLDDALLDAMDKVKIKDVDDLGVNMGEKKGDPPYVINYSNDQIVPLVKGMTIAKAVSQLTKGKGKDINDDGEGNTEATRIASIMRSRPSRLGDGKSVIAAQDDIAGGSAAGMNESPPPKGVKAAKLTDDHVAALGEYRGFGYEQVNGTLRGTKKLTAAQQKAAKAVVDDLDDAFKTAPATTAEIRVFRGTGDFKPPATFTDKAFVSTTYNKDSTRDFVDSWGNPKVMEIVIPKGTRTLKLSGGQSENHYTGESELLLPRGTTFTRQADGTYLASVP